MENASCKAIIQKTYHPHQGRWHPSRFAGSPAHRVNNFILNIHVIKCVVFGFSIHRIGFIGTRSQKKTRPLLFHSTLLLRSYAPPPLCYSCGHCFFLCRVSTPTADLCVGGKRRRWGFPYC